MKKHYFASLGLGRPNSGGTAASTVSFEIFDTVTEAFTFLTSKIKSQLTKADFYDIRRACIEQRKTPSGAQLSSEVETKVKLCTNIDTLFDALAESPCWNWIDLRLISAMAAASGLEESLVSIAKYKRTVFSRKVIDVIPNAPSREIKDKYYTRLVTKLKKDANEVTVADLLDFRSILEQVILDINNGVCVLEHIEGGCIEIHWLIPSDCVGDAYKSARLRCDKFEEISLLSIQIGNYPLIHSPQSKDDVVMPTVCTTVTTGTVACLYFPGHA